VVISHDLKGGYITAR